MRLAESRVNLLDGLDTVCVPRMCPALMMGAATQDTSNANSSKSIA